MLRNLNTVSNDNNKKKTRHFTTDTEFYILKNKYNFEKQQHTYNSYNNLLHPYSLVNNHNNLLKKDTSIVKIQNTQELHNFPKININLLNQSIIENIKN
jgi:hypothetical protein